MFQEIDIASGKVLLEWHSLDHIPITESYWPRTVDWDYVHLNSIAVDRDENLLVSSRNTHTIYKLDRTHAARSSGAWAASAATSAFGTEADVRLAARRPPPARRHDHDASTTATLISRALALDVDEVNRRVALRRAYTHPGKLHSDSQGNVQVLPNGNVLVGWGAQPYVSEFAASGGAAVRRQARRRAMSPTAPTAFPGSARAAGTPTVVTARSRTHTEAFVSWNGDTRVARWVALSGTDASTLLPIGSVARTGFETGMRLSRNVVRLAVRGVDASGATVGTSKLIAV